MKFNKTNQPKRNTILRYKNRIPAANMIDRKEVDVIIIDATLKTLYNEGDKVAGSLQDDVLKPNKIQMPESETDRIWDILINTGLVNPVIGFGNSGKLTLTNEGYQLMRQFGSYSAFVEERMRQSQQQQQGMAFPQFIIQQAEEEEEQSDENEKKDEGEKPSNPKTF